MKVLGNQFIGVSSANKVDGSLLTPVNGTPAAGQYRSTITNRASIYDFANDMRALGPVERIPVARIVQLQNEFGANGERVFKSVDDYSDRIRFVGNFSQDTSTLGTRIFSQDSDDYVEIVFFGTGLNLLGVPDSARDLRVTTDGGAEGGASIWPTMSSILSSRSYNANMVLPVVSGLAVGLHTVKLRQNGALDVSYYGFEILNEAASIRINPGAIISNQKRISLASAASLAYKPAGVGSRGARVVAYSAGGQIDFAFTNTNGSQANLTSADHTNEEIIRTYHWREFGQNRSDDFSSIQPGASSTRAFTLEDGTTTLVCQGCVYNAGDEFLRIDANPSFITFTFVGTGLDILKRDVGATTTNSTMTIDGVSIGSTGTTGNTTPHLYKIVSGLPYGTHTFRMSRNDGTNTSAAISQFIVYGQKKPAIPTGAQEIADYYVMADYVANTNFGVSSTTLNTISTGVLRKGGLREFIAVGSGFTVTLSLGSRAMGQSFASTTNGDYTEYTFYGTGFNLRIVPGTTAATATLSVDGSTNLSGFTTGAAGVTLTAATGVLNGTFNDGALVNVSGLSNAKHTVRITNTSTIAVGIDAFDIITPIHSPRGGLFEQQNTLPVGSNSLSDSRGVFPVSTQKFVGIARGVTSGPTTTSTSFVPCPEMSLTVPSKGGNFELSAMLRTFNSASGNSGFTQFYVNGLPVSIEAITTAEAASNNDVISTNVILYLPQGTHKIDLYWRCGAGTQTASGTDRQLTVIEL